MNLKNIAAIFFIIATIVFTVVTVNTKSIHNVGSIPVNLFSGGVNSAVSVATSNTQVAASNVGRVYMIITNDSANVVYLSLGQAAVSGSGIRLAVGGSYAITQSNLFVGQINAIAVGGASNVSIYEK